MPSTNDKPFENASVNDTYRTLNLASEVLVDEALDRNYRRCKSGEVKQLFARVPEEGWADYLIVEGEYVFDEELPIGKKRTVTAWRIGDGDLQSGRDGRKPGRARPCGIRRDTPARGFGRASLAALALCFAFPHRPQYTPVEKRVKEGKVRPMAD